MGPRKKVVAAAVEDPEGEGRALGGRTKCWEATC